MALDIASVRVGVTGAIYTNILGASAPTSAASVLSGYTDLGYVSEDGVTETNEISVDDIKAWQNATTVRKTVTDGSVSFSFTLIQTDANVLAAVYGTTIAGDGSVTITPTAERAHKAFVIDIVDGTEKIRIWVPDGQITEVGDIVYQNGEPIGYEVTLTSYPHASLNSGAGSIQKWFASLVAPTAPTLSSALPSGAAAGAMVKIVGTKFTGVTGVTGVKFGGVNAASYLVDDDSTIYATLPAGSAGSAPITVTNTTGTSTGLAYTRA